MLYYIMTNELREFVYLDTMGVNSLLASQYVALPETVREVSEDIEGDEKEKGIGLTLGYGPAKLSGDYKSGENEQERRLSETEQRINHQYRFSILHRVLENNDSIVELTEKSEEEDSIKANKGDVVKTSGNCVTDPFYRLLSATSLIQRVFESEEVVEQIEAEASEAPESENFDILDQWLEVLHGERIGLKLESEEFGRPIVMFVDIDDLWVNPQREFLGSRDYTVVARLERVMTGSEKWDFIDLLQIMDSVFSEESVEEFRDAITEAASEIQSIGEDSERAGFSSKVVESEYVVEEPALVVSPIAIYW